MPCYRYKILNACLVDHPEAPRAAWTLRWRKMSLEDIPASDWKAADPKTIFITQDVLGTGLPLTVREFTPMDGDAVSRKWMTNGSWQEFPCATYAITSMTEAADTYGRFMESNLANYVTFFMDQADLLVRITFSMAFSLTQDPQHAIEVSSEVFLS